MSQHQGADTMTSRSTSRRLLVALVCLALALVFTSAAAAHSSISPPIAKAKTLQQFTLEVQAEKQDARTTQVEVTFPDGFNVETFPARRGGSAARSGRAQEKRHPSRASSGPAAKSLRAPILSFTSPARSTPTRRTA